MGQTNQTLLMLLGGSDAILLLNDESEYGNPNLTNLFDIGVKGQDLAC